MDLTPKAKATKAKIKKCETTSNDQLLHSKRNHRQDERHSMDWEEVFANQVSNKGLISNIYKELLQLDSKKNKIKINNPMMIRVSE